ncbi:ABC transporter substrate-binding protein [Pseudosulfitobacter pseudonitzschiae]|uniref:ABC transporter substrate-binding protein n=1 Tax=Pseudosulfitobacter pseudonitzschiae TaxID=1402135 RepID=UPI001AF8E741|nr:ABC transporter substrate-binding protein [Pseudosulfitobacter pseudonitzschiae]MBM1816695.1 ABC transporter substrate-binding protein [Pseudosulfitobacter pseudonitzschiae]MBM1833505.1 ABC transporter substrate-binding protein [Pseudosulfitobacter pseudonitzschiae]MBM1838372.1 ABC transporter substrate-binding protein [Pseudosulfitobacter pseudonitzschiae]MBM1843422.1 ABC transporter substrate-binding protein [Pseudosulfitobacter pseudonitzschiae]MBM1848288.1 ABC transporter substrate-bind
MSYTSLTAALLGAALFAPVVQAQTSYPLTIENCGVQVTFDAAPETAVTVGQAGTEVLYALGLGDKVAGTSVWFTDVLPEYAALNADIERLADNDPSFESVVDKRPDIVVAQYEWHIGPQGIVATREQFTDLGIPTYVLPADCWAKDNSTGSDGTRLAMFEMDSIYAGVTQLAQIFDVSEKGAAMVADLKAREAAAIEKAAALDLQDASAVFWFSSTEMDIDPYVAGRKGPPGYMMEKLGLRNVVESDEEWPVVSWESIARANPSVIVVAEMDRRRFEADDVEKKLEFLRTDPVASQMDAVKNNRIVILNAHSMDPSIRNVTALETLAGALPEFDLQ